MGRWGHTLLQPYTCKRCKVSTSNPACLSCGAHLCEPCFQFAQECCTDMNPEDGHTRSFTIGDASFSELKLRVEKYSCIVVLQCINQRCLQAMSISKAESPVFPRTDTRPFRYCPACGGDAEIRQFEGYDYWNYLEERTRLPGGMLKLLHKEWDRSAHRNFFRFVRDLIFPSETNS